MFSHSNKMKIIIFNKISCTFVLQVFPSSKNNVETFMISNSFIGFHFYFELPLKLKNIKIQTISHPDLLTFFSKENFFKCEFTQNF